MVAYTRDEIISATLSSIADKSKEKIAITRNNKLEAVILPIEEYERLKVSYEMMEHKNEKTK